MMQLLRVIYGLFLSQTTKASTFAAQSAYLDAFLVFASTSLLGLNQDIDVYRGV